MANFSDVEFEKRYKQFLKTQKEWLELIADLTFYTDKNANGDVCRPLAFTNKEKVFKRAHEIVLDWQSFADLADEKRKNSDIAITRLVYTPVPCILVDPLHVTVTLNNATSTANHTREDLINRYDKQIAKLKKVPFAEGAIKSLRAEQQTFIDAPEASRYRARTGGYNDTLLEVVKPGNEKVEIMRYGSHGMLIYSRKLDPKKNIIVATEDRNDYRSLYDLIEPVPCALLPNAKLYSLVDIERGKLINKQRETVERTIVQRKFHFNRRIESKMARIKAGESADKLLAEIEESRLEMEELNRMDREIFELKIASGDIEKRTMTEIRRMYGNETASRRGKLMKDIIQESRSNSSKK